MNIEILQSVNVHEFSRLFHGVFTGSRGTAIFQSPISHHGLAPVLSNFNKAAPLFIGKPGTDPHWLGNHWQILAGRYHISFFCG